MNLEDIIPDPAARAFLEIIAAERGHDTAVAFLRDMLAGVWVYAGESQLLLETQQAKARKPALAAETEPSTSALQEALW